MHIPVISSIYLSVEKYANWGWRTQQIYSGSWLNENRLCRIILEKEQKIANYENCDEYWLIIAMKFMDRAQDQEMPHNIQKFLISDCYSRIILYRPEFMDYFEGPGQF